MIEIDLRLLAVLFALGVLLLFAVFRRWRAWRRSAHAKRRAARANRGERAAETLLEKSGYEILDRQLGTTWVVDCDGETEEFLLRADLLVSRYGQEYIAEVKTGELAPSLSNASTRRQMLEYSIAFDSPTILLVDVERGQIHEVCFENSLSELS